jgi:hypothetical protein
MLDSPSKAASVLAFAHCCLATLLFAADTPQDALWRKAIAIADANADWVPGLVVSRSEALYKGESAGVNEIWRRSTLDQKGEVTTETVKILEDGKDVTKQEKAKAKEKPNPAKPGNKGGGNPFDPEVQDRVTLKTTARSRVIADRDCLGIAFELKNTNGPTTRGTAWLDKETGTPTEIDNMTLDPLPDKHIKRLVLTSRYETTTNGGWHLRSMETTGTVARMFIHVDIRSTTTFSEHWKKPQHRTNAPQIRTGSP